MWKQDLRSPTNPPEKTNLFSISKIRKWKTEIKTKTKAHKLCLLYSLQNKQNKTNPFLMPVSYFNNLWSQETVHRGTFSWLSVANILHSVPLKCFYFLTCQTKWGNNWHRVISKCTEKTSPFCRERAESRAPRRLWESYRDKVWQLFYPRAFLALISLLSPRLIALQGALSCYFPFAEVDL